MTNKVWNYLLDIRKRKRAGYFILIDPDRRSIKESTELAVKASDAGVDAILIGSSLIVHDNLDTTILSIKKAVDLPVILFPGASTHVSRHTDAILFLSLISGRNPNYLIGEHVKAAPLIRHYKIETIPTGYLLIDGGNTTSVGFMSNTAPIPRNKPEIAWVHALAAQYLGMEVIYLEAGSGAKQHVPDEMIAAIKQKIDIPIIVGGGINTPEIASQKVEAGADFIVTGNVLEKNNDLALLREFVDAIH